MPNFVYDETDLYDPKTDRLPVTDVDRQWSAADANLVRTALNDIRTVLRESINVKDYGATGDGSTDDTAAIQAALDAAGATFGSGVFGMIVTMPKGIYQISEPLLAPNGVGLRGSGPASTWIRATNDFTGDYMFANLNQDGTQEFLFLEQLLIDGNKGGGAVCTKAAVGFVSMFINSYMKDVVIQQSSSVGLHVAGPNGMGPVYFENIWVLRSGGHNILVEEIAGNTHGLNGIHFTTVASEHQGTNSSAMYWKGLGHLGQCSVRNLHIEQGGVTETGRTAVTLDGCSHILLDGVQLEANLSTVTAGITITNVVQNVGIQIRGVTNQNLINPVLQDLMNGVTIGATNVNSYMTPDVSIQGGPTFLGASTKNAVVVRPGTGGKSLVASSSSGTQRVWFDENGRLTGTGAFDGSVEMVGNPTFDRPLLLINNALTRVHGFYYPDSASMRWRYFTGGFDALSVNNSGDVTTLQAFIASGQRRITGELVPAAITVSQNDYSPTGFATAAVVILSSTGAVNITGFGSVANGREIYVYNNGVNNITLKHQDAGSVAANRIIGRAAADVVLAAATGALLWYSPSITRWLVLL